MKNVRQGWMLLILAGLLLFFMLYSEPEVAEVFSDGASLEITHLTTGVIDADTLIAVRYRDEQIQPQFVGLDLEAELFSFTPALAGRTYWEDDRTLVFEPAEPLYEKRIYHAVLDYSPYLEADAVEFYFETLGQRLSSLSGRFEQNGFVASLSFSESIKPEQLREALTLKLEDSDLAHELETTDNRNFMIRSHGITRYDFQDRKVKLHLAAKPMGLPDDVEEEFLLTAAKTPLQVVRIEEEKQGEFSQLRIIFSDQLKEDKDYTGYMSISPTMKYGTKIDGDTLIITGDFRPREKYSIRLFPGIEGKSGQSTEEQKELTWEVEIADRNPAVEFLNDGTYLTSALDKRITFRTMNVERLRLQVKRVDEDNLVAFFEENSYQPRTYSFDDYNRYGFQRFGETLADTTVEIGSVTNRWIYSELDLSDVITDERSALYIVQLSFDENQALYYSPSLSNWEISDHTYIRGRATKHILVSDIGITAKQLAGQFYVSLTDLMSTAPMADAVVALKDKEDRILATARSDAEGWATLTAESGEARYIEVEHGDDFALLSLGASELNNSLFDVGGVARQDGVDAFLYTERGVYRPGDAIHVSAIVRNEEDTFPDNHPVTLRVYNPQGRLMHEAVQSDARDGFYAFAFETESTALTGMWQAVLDVGGRLFSHEVRIEEIVPYRIRVGITAAEDALGPEDEQVHFTLHSEYLFGAAAAGLRSETKVTIEPVEVSFAAFGNFTFDNESILLTEASAEPMERLLNDQGEASFQWDIPKLDAIPSALQVRIESRVYEPGGRHVPHTKLIPLSHYSSYVGIGLPESDSMAMGDVASFQVIHVSADGKLLPDSELEYAVYGLRDYWWWEYANESSFRRHYKSNQLLNVLETGTITTNAEGMAVFDYRLNDYGEILLEISDPQGGHTAGCFFSSYWWGDSPRSRTADIVNLKLDKDAYLPREKASVTLNTPATGRALLTVEKAGEILERQWQELDGTGIVTFEIEVTEDQIPNAYVNVMVYQPFGETTNDLPLRMYGILPLHVKSEDTLLGLELTLPEAIRPEEEFTVELQTTNGKQAQFTLAVVDEGILDITRFKTPEPWAHFFAKQRLLTRTYDNFSDVIDGSGGYIHNLLSVGGSTEAEPPGYRELQARVEDAMRFEPVSIFQGPFYTDQQGYASVDVTVPNYIGSVRVMVVGADQGRYGHQDKQVAVKSPLMVLPTLPRVLGPQDRIVVPVTIFALEDDLGEVQVTIDCQGPLEIVGERQVSVFFGTDDRQEVFFNLQAGEEIGVAEITVTAFSTAKAYENTSQVELAVRPYNPYIYLSAEELVAPGQTVAFEIPKAGVAGTDALTFTMSARRGLNIDHRLRWLIRCPYGCLEQITSAVFPQLYLAELYLGETEQLEKIDQNVNAAIQSFRKYQLDQGGFSYWPNGSVANEWATNYVGHFLLEASRKGYHVPGDLLDNWANYQEMVAKASSSGSLTQVYRLYLLALAGHPELSVMNYVRENRMEELGNPAKYLLAGAYDLLGYTKVRNEILSTADLGVADYYEFGDTFGSTLRDKAVILDVMVGLGDLSAASELYDYIARELSSNRWHSTQSTAYGLMALTKYVSAVTEAPPELRGFLHVQGGKSEVIKGTDVVVKTSLDAKDAQTLNFTNTSAIPLFATLVWEGIPKGDLEPVQKGLALKRQFFDDAGEPVDISSIKQGDSFYAVYQVTQEGYQWIDEVALVQILPAGWEIENLRLVGGDLPDWAGEYNLGQEEYVDIRDDRIMWFFDKHYSLSYDFIVKINAVTVGEFYLPPTLVEAMYNNDYKVTTAGQVVEVVSR